MERDFSFLPGWKKGEGGDEDLARICLGKGHDGRTNVTIYFHYDIIRNEIRAFSPFSPLTRSTDTPLVKFKVRSNEGIVADRFDFSWMGSSRFTSTFIVW